MSYMLFCYCFISVLHLNYSYNNFQHDPLSRCNCTPPYSAENAISCRDDLNPANGTYAFGALGHRPHVGTDMKVFLYITQKHKFGCWQASSALLYIAEMNAP